MAVTPKQLANLRPAKKGEVRNPKGRTKGARSLLSESFIKAIYEDFKEHGEEAIAMVRENDTSTYLRVIASIVPKELTLHEGESAVERILDSIPDGELAGFIEGVRLLAVATSSGTEAAPDSSPPELQGVH